MAGKKKLKIIIYNRSRKKLQLWTVCSYYVNKTFFFGKNKLFNYGIQVEINSKSFVKLKKV